MAWTVILEEGWPDDGLGWRLAMDVDVRARTVRLGPRVPGSGGLDVQGGAVARSFYDCEAVELGVAGAWLAGEEATVLLATVEAGFRCHTLWTGDLQAEWSEDAWAAGHALAVRVGELL